MTPSMRLFCSLQAQSGTDEECVVLLLSALDLNERITMLEEEND